MSCTHTRPRSLLRLIVSAAALASLQAPALLAADLDDGQSRMALPALSRTPHPAVARLGIASAYDTTWVGFRAGQTGNHWKVGVGPHRPGTNADGAWTFDTPVNGDSLQGWWPLRLRHRNASGTIRTDVNRPWWAIEAGNQASYVINQGRFDASLLGTPYPGNRTLGVVGVWHSDPGSNVPGATGAGGTGVSWAPLGGSKSAWMGLRQLGDVTAMDPVTGNPFNLSTVERIEVVDYLGALTTVAFPGYANQMDQMLYRDVDISATPGPVTLAFEFATRMSTAKTTTTSTRTGWFEGDPLSLNASTPGNFISAEAGVPANAQAPIDSFQVYVGRPVEGTWVGSDNVTRPIQDPLRRWFNEVLDKGARFWKLGRAGNNVAQTASVVISPAEIAAIKAGGNNTLRVVFRVHTNQTGSDFSGPSSYTSQGAGAAQVDDVSVDLGLGGGPVPIGDFEGPDPAKDIDNLQPATAAWRSTGKPPAIYMHVHDLASLPYNDLCGDVGGPNRTCDMRGAVLSVGLHDAGEAQAGAAGSAENNGEHAVMSPTINLRTAGPNTPNGWDLTGDMVNATGYYGLYFDVHTELFDLFNTGAAWHFGTQSYPALQPAGGPAPGTPQWGEMRYNYNYIFWPELACWGFLEDLSDYGLVVSANAPAPPDSIRIFLMKVTQCYRFGITTGCQTTAGGYFDNVALALIDAPTGPALSVDTWNLFHDTFPFNETTGLPGTAAFDTTSALIRTGLNVAQTVGGLNRFDVPGDSVVVFASGPDTRVDLVFRIRPGVGNHVTVGDPSSGLRQAPTSAAPAVSGDGSFWGQYLANAGEFATPGHAALDAAAPGGWDPNVWRSARCDTAQTGLFPRGAPVPSGDYPVAGGALSSSTWMSTYHEADPHLPALGIARPMCFLSDTNGAVNSTNIVCGSAPAWITTLPASRTGWAGNVTTTEGTQILPDGLFTPGTHVQYFLRRSAASAPGTIVAMCPDTGIVVPQPAEASLDGHRWQQFGVLPDRWKDAAFGGSGMACMLVLDWADRRGDELAWVGIADSIGATAAAKRGAHNGWSGPGGVDPNDPAHFVAAHGGQPGTTWDLYGVKAGENGTTAAGTVGGRLAYRDPNPANLVHGKYARMAPTQEMLEAYYRVVMLLTADLSGGVLGPYPDRSADDRAVLTQFLQNSPADQPRGLLAFGDGLAESEAGTPFLDDVLGVQLIAPDYMTLTGDNHVTVPLALSSTLDPGGTLKLEVANSCRYGYHDVLDPNPAVPEAGTATWYAPAGGTPYGAAVHKAADPARPWIAMTHGFRVGDPVVPFGDNSHGRHLYTYAALTQLFGSICTTTGTPVSVGERPAPAALRDYLRLANNPLRSGAVAVEFGLPTTDRVEVGIFDVSGRRVRMLAERLFPAGEHRLAWDGRDDAGRAVARGVYFTRLRYAGRGFETTSKLVVLR